MASSNVRITPISDSDAFSAYIVEVDATTKILIDCGCGSDFDFAPYDACAALLAGVDCVLLSHADMAYIGALPYVVARYALSCPIFATVPVANIGLVSHYDAYEAMAEDGCLPAGYSLDDVDTCFEKIIRLKFQQTAFVAGLANESLFSKGITAAAAAKSLSVTPFAAGHSVGAAVWRIRRNNNEDILYAVDFNHKKERHIDGVALELLTAAAKPSILIANSRSIFDVHRNKKQRDAEFIEACVTTLRTGGSTLVPVAATARIFELLLLLEQHWTAERFSWPIFFVAPQSSRLVEHAKSMLEWMGEAVIREFGATRHNPFEMRHVTLLNSEAGLPAPGVTPCVILATGDVERWGAARRLFMRYAASSAANCVIFVGGSGGGGSEGRTLCDRLQKQRRTSFVVRHKVLLQGEELAEHRKQAHYLRAKARAEAHFAAVVERRQQQEEHAAEDDEGDDENAETIADAAAQSKRDFDRLKLVYWSERCFDLQLGAEVRSPLERINAPATAATYAVFPSVERRVKFDDYGEALSPHDFAHLTIRGDDHVTSVQGGSGDLSVEGKGSLQKANEDEDDEKAPPFKWAVEEVECLIAARLVYVDFEGRSDGRSVRTVMARIAPRKLVIVGGSSTANTFMANVCRASEDVTSDVVVAPSRQTTCVSVHGAVATVKIDAGLLARLSVRTYGAYELAFVCGTVETAAAEAAADAVLRPSTTEETTPAVLAATSRTPLLVGNSRLSAVRRRLVEEAAAGGGFSVDLHGGQLACGSVVLRKAAGGDAGSFVLEGPLGAEFFAVRDAFYSQLAAL